MSKRFLMVVAFCVLALLGIFAATQNKAGAPSNTNSNAKPSNHILGEGKKKVTLVEYGDYQCPVCYSFYPTIKEVQNKFADDIYFQFRNLPLSQIHKNAFAAARAAEAANLQNKFWEMNGLIYQNQDPSGQSGWVISESPLENYFVNFAQQIGLNVTKFKQDYAGSQVNDTINADLAAFNKTGQQMGTPTFFLDGKYIKNEQLSDKNGPSVDKFSKIIEAAISAKNK